KAHKAAVNFCQAFGRPNNLAEITKERLRRVAEKIRLDNPVWGGDSGFRVFKLDTTSIREWNPDRSHLERSLLDSVNHLKDDRSDLDLIFELMLKLGLDLCTP